VADFHGAGSFFAISPLADELPNVDILFVDRIVTPEAAKKYGTAKRDITISDAKAPVAVIEAAAKADHAYKTARVEPWKGPSAELNLLRKELGNHIDRAVWLNGVRARAIVGSCPKSLASAVSGIG
jgi:hypothetical protein